MYQEEERVPRRGNHTFATLVLFKHGLQFICQGRGGGTKLLQWAAVSRNKKWKRVRYNRIGLFTTQNYFVKLLI